MTTLLKHAIGFIVYGRPAQQGSKSAFVRNGKAIMIESNQKAKAEWRQSVVVAGQVAMHNAGLSRFAGPVALTVSFYFRRPKSHFGVGRKSSVLKLHAPKYHVHSPDLDKLIRNVSDGLTGVVIDDDRQICDSSARREWTDLAERAEIEVSELAE